jgi:hypothetical protein
MTDGYATDFHLWAETQAGLLRVRRANEIDEDRGMTAFRPPPERHWRSYGDDHLPSPAEALAEPFVAFPSWFLRIECERCGKVQMVSQVYFERGHLPLRTILAKMRHDGCGGLPAKAELLTGIEGVSSRPVRRIVLRAG